MPICKVKEIINLPLKIIKNTSPLTTVSIPKGKVCDHHFQIFVDKAFKIRGYQKVDFEFEFTKNLQINSKNLFKNGLNLYENTPEKNSSSINTKQMPFINKNDRFLSKIYEDFWEFIDDDNELFQKYIISDTRRKRPC